jgi:hypothetical protein
VGKLKLMNSMKDVLTTYDDEILPSLTKMNLKASILGFYPKKEDLV